MSVLKSERDESSLSYFYNAITLRKELTLLLLRDFGVKDKYRKFKDFSQHFSFFDRHIFQHLLKKYRQEHIIYSYPSWLIDYCRKNILKSCYNLIENITLAHNIHPIIQEEVVEKRILIDKAIGNCEHILQELQYTISILPVNVNKYMRYVELVIKEEKSLKKWRKENNRIYNKLSVQGDS